MKGQLDFFLLTSTMNVPLCLVLFLIALAGLRFYGGNLALHHEFDVGTIITFSYLWNRLGVC